MQLNRFMWEDLEKGVFRKNKRIRTVLKFENTQWIAAFGLVHKYGLRDIYSPWSFVLSSACYFNLNENQRQWQLPEEKTLHPYWRPVSTIALIPLWSRTSLPISPLRKRGARVSQHVVDRRWILIYYEGAWVHSKYRKHCKQLFHSLLTTALRTTSDHLWHKVGGGTQVGPTKQ